MFDVELSQIDYNLLKSFCELQLSEGERIEYKMEFPAELGLEKTISAMGNTFGGVILIGVKANKTTNKPTETAGIELVKGIEEKIVSRCLSNIFPPLVPEIKVCEFSSSSQIKPRNRALVFIRVPSSYQAPHEIIRTNEIPIRAHNRNATADLKTIERLLKRRDEVSESHLDYAPRCNYKYLGIESEQFESVVMHPKFSAEPIIFFNKDTDNWLHKLTEDVLTSWHQRKPGPHQLQLLRLTPGGRIKGFCEIREDGHVVFQRPAEISDDSLSVVSSMRFLADVLGTTKALYSHFGYYGEILIGFSVCGAKDIRLRLPKRRYLDDDYTCENPEIYIQRNLTFSQLDDVRNILEDVFRDLCRWFGLVLDEKYISEIINELR